MLTRVRGRAPSLPTAISLLALSIVLTGTAFAATGQLVTIVDPTNHARAARVGAVGGLQVNITDPTNNSRHATVGPGGALLTRLDGATVLAPSRPFASAMSLSANVMTQLTPPTTATLAFTRFLASNLADSSLHSAFQISLYQVGGTGGTCNGSASYLASYDVSPSNTVVDSLPIPMTLHLPSGSSVWCLEAIATLSDNPSSYYLPHFAWSGYVVSGSFSGLSASTPKPAAVRQATARGVR